MGKFQKRDEFFMRYAMSLAIKSRPSPNPRVGAVIVKNGKIIGKGYHRKAGEPHAEINAINDAKRKMDDLSGCSLYVTLEPCCIHGRTPPCTNAILNAGIKEIVIACKDPNPKVAGKGLVALKKAGVKIRLGVLQEDSKSMNEGYNFYIRHNKPLIVLKAAISLDGKISTENGESKWISGRESRQIVHKLRSKYDAVLVGSGTVLADNPRLTSRIKHGIDPLRVILDSRLRISLRSNVFADSNVVVFTSDNCNISKMAGMKKAGIGVFVSGQKKISLNQVLARLVQLRVTSILVEGGEKVFTSFIREKLANKIILFIAPKIIGSRHAPSILYEGSKTSSHAIKLKNIKYQRFADDIMVEGEFK